MRAKKEFPPKKNSGRQPSSRNRRTKFPGQRMCPETRPVPLVDGEHRSIRKKFGQRHHLQAKKAKGVRRIRAHSIKSRRGEIAKVKLKKPVTSDANIVPVCTLIPYERDGAAPKKRSAFFIVKNSRPSPAVIPGIPKGARSKEQHQNRPGPTVRGGAIKKKNARNRSSYDKR